MRITCSLLLAWVLTGCTSAPILERSPYWPFERIRLQSRAVGALTVYTQRPDQAARAVVIVQSPPCGSALRPAVNRTLSTAGILWDELKPDSVLLQLEPPGAGRDDDSVAPQDCWPELRTAVSTERWSRALHEALIAIEGESRLSTVYIGIGQGAQPAVELAAQDRRAAALLIVNGIGLNPHFESLLTDLQGTGAAQDLRAGTLTPSASADRAATRPLPTPSPLPSARPGVPTLLVQSTVDQSPSLESGALLLSQWAAAGGNISMIVAEGLGTDFGLDSGRIECFENMMRLIAQRARQMGPPAPLMRVYCSSEEQAPPQEERTAPLRLPDAAEEAERENDAQATDPQADAP
jgi:hypothetical protein